MKRVFLHIGTHKTGTTAIQKFCANAEDRLRRDGILYPKSGRPKVEHGAQYGHHLLAWAIRGKKGIDHIDDWNKVLKEIDAAEQQTVVLSSEDFETCTEEEIAQIDAILEGFDVHVILYLRNPLDFLVSSYKQFVKGGKTAAPFDTFVERGNWKRRCDYSSLIQKWAGSFGADNVHVRLYDKYNKACSVERSFLELFDLDADYYEGYMTPPINVSPSNKQIALVRRVNSIEKVLTNSSILRRIRGSVLRKNRAGAVLLALTSPFLYLNGFGVDEMHQFSRRVNKLNRSLVGNHIAEHDWNFIEC
jgi:hypothetical protein